MFLRHQLHFQKQSRFPGVCLQKGVMSVTLTYTHHCSSETSCFTHWPLDILGLKLPEEFGATYGKLYCSAALSNFQPSGPQVSCTIKKGMQAHGMGLRAFNALCALSITQKSGCRSKLCPKTCLFHDQMQ